MDSLISLFVIVVVLAAALAIVSVWAPRKSWVKAFAVATSALFIAVAYAALADLLSKPKPVRLEWAHRHVPEATVLAATAKEGDGIYLWLQFDGVAEPRSYVIPWDLRLAEQLQEAMREAEKNGNGLRLKLPFEPSLEDRGPKFYALPQPAFPPKDRDEDGPLFYKRPGIEA